MRILLVTPPMTQLNTPYPATPHLTGLLRAHAGPGVQVAQADLALELFLRLFSRAGLRRVHALVAARAAAPRAGDPPAAIAHFLAHAESYVELVEPVVRFLQGRDPALGLRIAGGRLLPEGPRFAAVHAEEDALDWAFGALGTTDRARHLASLFIDDLADVIRAGVDPRFELARYGEALAASAPSFAPLARALAAAPTLVDDILDDLTRAQLAAARPDLLGITIPFPGNVYGALRIARLVKQEWPHVAVVAGGGYVSTELRQLSEPRVFDYFDYVTLDDGAGPLLALIEHLADERRPLLRTFVRAGDRVAWRTSPAGRDVPHAAAGTPTYDGLPLASYVSLFEMLNPMHRLWADGRWNKLAIAHGCYWKQCAFCDVTLDYIARYDAAPADVVVDRIAALVAETGQTGFHFIDEAAPPAALRAVAERLVERRLAVTWWGNIRFEKTFTPELVDLLARSGCVAVSGGLEMASDRLLKLMNKGVSVGQVARVTHAFAAAGVLVHAYLMYGFPTETEQETVDALERVRQLFAAGCLHSAFWHRFAATAHSLVGTHPERFGVRLLPEPRVTFARNEVPFEDPMGADHAWLGVGLRRALHNYMLGLGLDADVRSWFVDEEPAHGRRRGRPRPRVVPAPQVAPDLIRRALRASIRDLPTPIASPDGERTGRDPSRR